MSFGFSVGDFVAVANLIKDISSSIRSASAASYRALDLELHSLTCALDGIERLQGPPGLEAAVNQVKVAALNCRHPLDIFASKIKKYSVLSREHGVSLGLTDKLVKVKRKVQWGLEMEEEAVKLRTSIVAHVGFLSLRLSTLGLNSSFLATHKTDDRHLTLLGGIKDVRSDIAESRREHATLGSLIANTSNVILQTVSDIASVCIGVQLDSLLELAQNIWKSNTQLVALVSEMHSRPPRIDTGYTWFQEPIRFEDAFGRILPIPSEYSWSKVHVIILDQFSTGIGSNKVKAGEYLLYNSLEPKRPLKQDDGSLMPGMSVTMTLILGRYGPTALDRCPRVGCLSSKVVKGEFGTSLCSVCRCWFNGTNTRIACPLRYESLMGTPTMNGKHTPGRHRRLQELFRPRSPKSDFKDKCDERRSYKNLSIYAMELPATLKVSNIRRSEPRSQQRGKGSRKARNDQVDDTVAWIRGVMKPAFRAEDGPVARDRSSPVSRPSPPSPGRFEGFTVNSVNSFTSSDSHSATARRNRSEPASLVFTRALAQRLRSDRDGVDNVESKLPDKAITHELGGSLPALVECLTTHEFTPDAAFVSTFYRTFRLFCTPVKLTETLIDRFDYAGDFPHMAGPVRLKVYYFFKNWLESHWREETDREAVQLIIAFAHVRLSAAMPSAGRQILALARRNLGGRSVITRLVSSMGTTNTAIAQHVSPDAMPIGEMSRLNAQSFDAQAVLSPRTTRRSMLSTELTESLHRNLLRERHQEYTTGNAVSKRRHISQDMAKLEQAPEKPCIKKSEDANASNWNQYFSEEDSNGYHSKGW